MRASLGEDASPTVDGPVQGREKGRRFVVVVDGANSGCSVLVWPWIGTKQDENCCLSARKVTLAQSQGSDMGTGRV